MTFCPRIKSIRRSIASTGIMDFLLAIVCWTVLNRGNTAILEFRLLGHRIILSALAKTLGGIVNPICFAVLALITNSNFVGCSTGRSAGLVPFKILST